MVGKDCDRLEALEDLVLLTILVQCGDEDRRQDERGAAAPLDVAAHLLPLAIASAVQAPGLEVGQGVVGEGPFLGRAGRPLPFDPEDLHDGRQVAAL